MTDNGNGRGVVAQRLVGALGERRRQVVSLERRLGAAHKRAWLLEQDARAAAGELGCALREIAAGVEGILAPYTACPAGCGEAYQAAALRAQEIGVQVRGLVRSVGERYGVTLEGEGDGQQHATDNQAAA